MKDYYEALTGLEDEVITEAEALLKELKQDFTSEDGKLEIFEYLCAEELGIESINSDGIVVTKGDPTSLRSLVSDIFIPLCDAISLVKDLRAIKASQ